MSMNQMAVTKNSYQGKYKKVLCVCSAGCLRSPTAAVVLSHAPFDFNTRACGIDPDFAIIPITDVLIEWADEIVCMTQEHKADLLQMTDKPIVCLDIPDNFEYRNPKLMKLVKEQYLKVSQQGFSDEKKD